MSSIFPQQYMDTEDIRMMRAVLLLAGYGTSKLASDIKLDRAAAAYLIQQFRSGTTDPSFMLHNLEHRSVGTPRQDHLMDLWAWENEGGALMGVNDDV
ncbi:hypothetical protein J2Y48_005081 [Mycoplana sp. BE70]|uniref:hypothetical protein n=1 Tax=Mycoplana sp. BE70 TaxID=2817775 RepID=UPI00285C1303|nr:hypothetical protein [Mycoplana sp. BE70]MDR6759763.1 hypothetical protein [Mycoplana sp. BE70]